jgi:hypothetical protein
MSKKDEKIISNESVKFISNKSEAGIFASQYFEVAQLIDTGFKFENMLTDLSNYFYFVSIFEITLFFS